MNVDVAASAQPSLTKIIATIGPACSDAGSVRKLIEAGVSIFRFNFGHGDVATRTQRVQTIRAVAEDMGRPIALMGDIQGPKIRVGEVMEGGVFVEPGAMVIFQRQAIQGSDRFSPLRLSSTYERLIDDVEPGQRVLIADGAVRMLAISKTADELHCAVSNGGGGRITSGKGVNLPDTAIRSAAMNERDWNDVKWAVECDFDFLAMSFVRAANDIDELRAGMMKFPLPKPSDDNRQSLSPIQVVAKIERPEAVNNIESILQTADAIMVARGDLGVEMDLARVPVIQKQLLNAAKAYGKPAIVATQMLESMIHAPAPTRAEASDVAAAILDGADAVMLSGETAVGEYPVLAVEHMRRIALHTEQYVRSQPQQASPPQKLVESRYRTAALAHGAWHIANDIGAKLMIVWSQRGGGARYLSQNEFCIPIIACTSDDRAARQMQLLRAVIPLRMPIPEGLAHFTRLIDVCVLEANWANTGDVCLMMAGSPLGTQGVTNSLAIHTVGTAG